MKKALQYFIIFVITFVIGIVLWTVLADMKEEPTETADNEKTQQREPARPAPDNSNFIGTWKTGNDEMYHTLMVYDDSSMMVDNNIDTMYTCNYKIAANSIIVFDGRNNMSMHKILKFNKDSFIVQGMMKSEERMAYYRDY